MSGRFSLLAVPACSGLPSDRLPKRYKPRYRIKRRCHQIYNVKEGFLIHMLHIDSLGRESRTVSSCRRLLISCLVVALLLSVMTAPAAGDEHTGEVTGTVSTDGGYVLEDADVRLVNISTGDTETTTSDSNGSYSFSSVEAGAYRLEAGFRGGEAIEDVTVEEGETRNTDLELTPEEAYFTVSVDGTNSPVTAGEDTRIDVTVTNRGEDSGSQAVRVEIPDIGEDAEPVSLNGGSSMAVSLSTPTDIDDAGEYTAEVSTNDDTADTEFVVDERGTDMDVSVSDTNSPVTEGETLTVEATVSNPTDIPGSGTVTAEVDGLGSDTGRFSLSEGEDETKNFEIPTEDGDAGEYTVTVSVGGATDSTDVTVEEDTEEGENQDNETGTDEGSQDEGTEDGDTDDGSGTDGTNESTTGETGADGSGGDSGDTEPLGVSTSEILRYLGMGIAALVAVAVVVASSVLVVRKLKQRDWGGTKSDEDEGEERTVLDTDTENEVYASWNGMINRAGVRNIQTKTPNEIAESAKEAGLDPSAVDKLTDVFEEVRYRDAEPTAEQERRAKEAFERIKKSDREE